MLFDQTLLGKVPLTNSIRTVDCCRCWVIPLQESVQYLGMSPGWEDLSVTLGFVLLAHCLAVESP